MVKELKEHFAAKAPEGEDGFKPGRTSQSHATDVERTFTSAEDEPFGSTAEQLNDGMIFLHRQPPVVLHDLVSTFCQEIERAWNDDEKAATPPGANPEQSPLSTVTAGPEMEMTI